MKANSSKVFMLLDVNYHCYDVDFKPCVYHSIRPLMLFPSTVKTAVIVHSVIFCIFYFTFYIHIYCTSVICVKLSIIFIFKEFFLIENFKYSNFKKKIKWFIK